MTSLIGRKSELNTEIHRSSKIRTFLKYSKTILDIKNLGWWGPRYMKWSYNAGVAVFLTLTADLI